MIDTHELYQHIIMLAEKYGPHDNKVGFWLEKLKELDEKAFDMCAEYIATEIIGG